LVTLVTQAAEIYAKRSKIVANECGRETKKFSK
jgi:hypothetical protein